jgi:hypothetical protein
MFFCPFSQTVSLPYYKLLPAFVSLIVTTFDRLAMEHHLLRPAFEWRVVGLAGAQVKGHGQTGERDN